jgi:DNA-binding transcriptional MerR regulator
LEARRWRIGELARVTGLTVRTLHHYEAVGLLSPAARTDAGHRIYGPADVRSLYRVMALRSLGLGLTAIRDCLAGDDGALENIVRRHLAEIEWSIGEQTRQRSRLQFILSALERNEEPSTDRFLEAMEAITMFERYFSQEQLAELQERHHSLGDEAVKSAEREWTELLAQADEARKAGVDPASPELNDLWRGMQELIEQFTGGNPTIRQSLQTMYETEDIAQTSRGAVSPELWDYMRRGQTAAK